MTMLPADSTNRGANLAALLKSHSLADTLVRLLMLYCDFETKDGEDQYRAPKLLLLQSLLEFFIHCTETRNAPPPHNTHHTYTPHTHTHTTQHNTTHTARALSISLRSHILLAAIYILAKYKHSTFFRVCCRNALILLATLTNDGEFLECLRFIP